MKEGKKCNRPRADLLLKTIPTDDPIYKRHAEKLYRMRFLQKFPDLQQYLQDQKSDKGADITKIGNVLKENLKKKSAELQGVNPTYNQQLQTALNDIDNLCKFAIEKNLYWAFRFFYWIQLVSLPNWYGQFTSGHMGPGVQINIKNFCAVFQILENNIVNPHGKSFTETFNEVLRLFQMTSIIPQMVDLEGNLGDVDSIIQECLQTFYEQFKTSTDPKLVENVQNTLVWLQQKALRKMFLETISSSLILSNAGTSWSTAIAHVNQRIAMQQEIAVQFKNVQSGIGWMVSLTAIALIALPLIPGTGGFKALSDQEKSQFIMYALEHLFQYQCTADPVNQGLRGTWNLCSSQNGDWSLQVVRILGEYFRFLGLFQGPSRLREGAGRSS